ncbi:TPA: hypothetical protein ACJCXE_004374 [Yersinia enterocolitica]|nr:hypothetical protein [Yersinia enterocolitica]HDL7743541.1 hypothetical protein [Yersinia enterocolitica]HDM8283893.1 hypothetical protein [Yersinia enterocolitica]HDY4940722.1 hypothetical protein [Yersinia enterocolitica]HEB2019115.1 hypothetical protein [Yersinia enterocolitica]
MWSYVGISLAGIGGLGLVREVLRNIKLSMAIWVGLRRVIGAASRAFSLSVSMTRSIVAAIQQSALATILSEV